MCSMSRISCRALEAELTQKQAQIGMKTVDLEFAGLLLLCALVVLALRTSLHCCWLERH